MASTHFSSSFIFHSSLTDSPTTVPRQENKMDFTDPVSNERAITAQNISLSLNSAKSEVIWTETFRSSLSKNFQSFLSTAKALDWGSDKI